MSIHFQGGRLECPVEASPNDNGNWDVTRTPGNGPTQVRGDLFDRDYPAIPNKQEFRRLVRGVEDGVIDVRAELDTHEFRVAHTEDQLSELPHDALVLLNDHAMRPADLPHVWSGWGTDPEERFRSWPLVALVPKN